MAARKRTPEEVERAKRVKKCKGWGITIAEYDMYMAMTEKQRREFREKKLRERQERMTKARNKAYEVRGIVPKEPQEQKSVSQLAKQTAQPLKVAPSNFHGLFHEEQLRIRELLAKYKVDPLEGLLRDLNSPRVPAKEKIAIRKFLLPYVVSKKPELKAMDIQQDIKMNVSVTVKSFSKASAEDLFNVTPTRTVDPSDYDEFMADASESEESGETGGVEDEETEENGEPIDKSV